MKNPKKLREEISLIARLIGDAYGSSDSEQLKYLNSLIALIDSEQYELFVNEVNSVELWGGSGAIWENDYGMNVEQRRLFDDVIYRLLVNMKEENIMQERAKGIFEILSVTK